MTRALGRRAGVLAAAITVVVMLSAFAAWACISVAGMRVTPTSAKAGDQVTVSGFEFNSRTNAVIRWNAVDGPVLAEVKPDGGDFTAQVTIPADAKAGNYVLVATQEPDVQSTTWGIPARALVQVVGDGGAPVVGEPVGEARVDRPVGLVTTESAGLGDLALAGLGAAGVAMFIAGMAALAAGRKTRVAETVPAKR